MRPEHLAFASGKSLFPIGQGGGETIAHDLLAGLSRDGCRAEAFGLISTKDIPALNEALRQLDCDLELEVKNLEITTRSGKKYQCFSEVVARYRLGYPISLAAAEFFLDHVEKNLARGGFDFLLFQAELSPQLFEIAERRGVHPIFYAQNGLELSLFQNPGRLPLVLANSKFFRDRLRREHRVRCELLYPAVDLERYRVSQNSHQYMTMINPVKVKGVLAFLQMALALPRRQFLVVEGWATPVEILRLIKKMPNVTYLEKQVDMRCVYEKTHVLIVPSQWDEAFGRVIVEAQVNGIPVLASQVGGIPEALGEGGVLVKDFKNPEAWLDGLARVEASYDELSPAAEANSQRFSQEKASRRFMEIIESIVEW